MKTIYRVQQHNYNKPLGDGAYRYSDFKLFYDMI